MLVLQSLGMSDLNRTGCGNLPSTDVEGQSCCGTPQLLVLRCPLCGVTNRIAGTGYASKKRRNSYPPHRATQNHGFWCPIQKTEVLLTRVIGLPGVAFS